MEEFALPYNQLVRLEFAEKKGQIWHIGQVKVITKKMKSSKLGVMMQKLNVGLKTTGNHSLSAI